MDLSRWPKQKRDQLLKALKWFAAVICLGWLIVYLRTRGAMVARGDSPWVVDLAVVAFALYLFLPWYRDRRASRRWLNERVDPLEASVRAVEEKSGAAQIEHLQSHLSLARELMLADAAPRVLKAGLPPELVLAQRDLRVPLILLLLGILGFLVFLALVEKYKEALLGSALLVMAVCAVVLSKPPRLLVANPKGVQIDGVFRPWREICAIREIPFGAKPLRMEIRWTWTPHPRWALASVQPGSARIPLRLYLPTVAACEEAFAILRIWHSRAQPVVQDTTPSDFSRTLDEKMAAVEALAETDPEGAERLLEKSLAEMEALHQAELERHRPGRPK